MPCVACREVVVDAVYATVHATDDYLRWASSHCARASATANGDLARPQDLAQPKPAQRTLLLRFFYECTHARTTCSSIRGFAQVPRT